MNRDLLYALALLLLAAEMWAQFVAHDQQWTTAFAILTAGVLAVRYLLGEPADGQTCPPDCPKCHGPEAWRELP